MASVLGSEKINNFFVSSLDKCESGDALIESRKLEDKIIEADIKGGVEKSSKNKECKNRRYSSDYIFYTSMSLCF